MKKVENGMKSPTRELRNGDTGKVIFNKFDLVQDPLEKKESQKVIFGVNFDDNSKMAGDSSNLICA